MPMIVYVLAALLMLAVPAKGRAQTSATEAGLVSQSQIEDFGQALGAAEASAARPVNRLTLEMIKDFEGWVPSAYNDPVGYCTIGYGHLIAMKRCEEVDLGDFRKTLTPADGETLLQRDTASARLAVQRWVTVDLTDDQFGALVSFVFNVGKVHFQRSTLLGILNAGNYKQAPAEMRRWVTAKGQVLTGLVQRRSCEAAQFRGDLKLTRDGRFDRGSCANLGIADGIGPLIDINTGE